MVHFDPFKDLILSCDASPYGVGSVLSHKMEDGSEKHIRFQILNTRIVFSVKQFHQYLHGSQFSICSDHQPLKYLFNESRQTSVKASSRVHCWALTLGAYKYTIRHKPGSKMAHVDGISCLPLLHKPSSVPVPGDMILLTKFVCVKSVKQIVHYYVCNLFYTDKLIIHS